MKLISLIIFGLLPFVMLVNPIKESIKNKLKPSHFFKEYKSDLVLVLFLLIGTIVRLYNIDRMTNALNVDEASRGYEAFSILKSGVDRSGRVLPVFLYSWGSGQNPLYSYILIPIIAIGGLTEFTLRLPMAIIGIISLYVFYYLLYNVFEDKKISILGLAFFAICPWHIMKSRWALESNLFPDLILISSLLIILGFKNKKELHKTLGFIILGLSSYSYSTSYIFLPIFVLGILAYLYYKKEIRIIDAVKYVTIIFVISLPIILYIFINVFDLNEFKFLGFTIPKLAQNRYEEASIIFQDNMFEKIVDSILATLRLLIIQNDGLEWNSLPNYGLFYLISSVFLFIGLICSLKKYKDNIFNQIMNIWMLAAIVVSAFCVVNINRVNIIMIPCIYYIVLGLFEFTQEYKVTIPILIVIYLYSFLCFSIDYKHLEFNNYSTFTSGIKEVSNYCTKQKEVKDIYCEYSFKEPYIYFLFYQKGDPFDFIDSVQYIDKEGTFDNVKEYGKYHFYLPKDIKKGDIIIVPKDRTIDYNIPPIRSTNINQFTIYEY